MFLSSSRRSAGSRSSAFVPKLSTQDTISARLDALSERMSEPSGVRSMRCPSLQMRSPTYVAADFGNFMTAVKGDSSMMPK